MNLAFNNDPALAEMVRNQIAAHTAADEVIQGTYWENGKGCFIGCIAHSEDTGIVEQMIGFPLMLTRIAESVFEGLPNGKAKLFPQQIINAPKVGADLSLVAWKFLHWCVTGALDKCADAKTREGCRLAVEVLAKKAWGEEVLAATSAAAYSAAAAAARSADAASAAYYAATSAAASADADSAAYYAARIQQAAKLIELLTEA